MLKSIVERLRQFMGLAAIAILAIAPFASSVMNVSHNASSKGTEVSRDGSDRSAVERLRMEYRTPSYEELAPAFEQVRSARMELMRYAAQQGSTEVANAVQRYQEAIRVWKAKLCKVQERTDTDQGRDIWYEFSAMQRTVDVGRRVYAWEIDQGAQEPN